MKLPTIHLCKPEWLEKSYSEQPWTIYTALAGLCLFIAALFSVSGSGWLVFLDVVGDILALYLFHRYGREPKPGDPDYVPRVSGRRKAAVTLGVLGGVIGATSIKAITDILNEIVTLFITAGAGQYIELSIPSCLASAILAATFTLKSLLFFALAHRSATKRHPLESVPLGTRTTLKANRVTGGLNGLVQLAFLVWAISRMLTPQHLASDFGKQLVAGMPLIQLLAQIITTGYIAYYIISRGISDVRTVWGPLVGQNAPDHVILSLRRAVASLTGVHNVKSLSVVEIGPEDADVNAEINLEQKAKLSGVKLEIARCAQEAAALWRVTVNSDDPIHKMHLRIEWNRNDKPISRFASSVESIGSIIPSISGEVVPILHYTSSSGRVVDPAVLSILRDHKQSLDPYIDLDTARISNNWDSIIDRQERTIDGLNSSPSGRTQKIAYFGLADIPETVHLGYLLGNVRAIELFQHDMNTISWASSEELQPNSELFFAVKHHLSGGVQKHQGPVAIKVEVSSKITDEDVQAVLGEQVPIISVAANFPARGLRLSQTELGDLARHFNDALNRVVNSFPYRSSIELFCSTPCGASLQVGRQINTRMHGLVQVYFYDRRQFPYYVPAITLGDVSSV